MKTPLWLWMLFPLTVLGPALTCGIPRVMAPLFLISGLLAIITYGVQNKTWPRPDKTLFALFGATLLYGVVSFFWSIGYMDVAKKSTQLAQVFGVTAFLLPILKTLDDTQHRKLSWMLFSGFSLGAALYLSEIFTNFAFYDLTHGGPTNDVIDNKQNKAAVIIALWGMLYSGFVLFSTMSRKALVIVGVMALSIVITLNSKSESGALIAIAAAPLALALYALPARLGLKAMLVTILALFTMMPYVAQTIRHTPAIMNDRDIPTSLLNRFEIWDMTARRIAEHPVRGWGLEASPYLPNRGEHSMYYKHKFSPLVHLHPHNGPLQMWLEMGAPGMICGSLFFLLMFTRLNALGSDTAIRYGTFAMGIIFAVTLSIWGLTQTWFMALLAACGVLAASALPKRTS